MKHPFLSDYGWAAYTNKKGTLVTEPDFSMLEQFMEMNHLRGYYREASENIHGGSIRMFNSLSIEENHQGPVLHTGPSINGLAMPLHLAAIALCQLTQNLLTLTYSIEHNGMCIAIKKMVDEIGNACIQSEAILDK